MKSLKLALVSVCFGLTLNINAQDYVCNYTKITNTLTRNTSYIVSFNKYGRMTVETVLASKRTLADGSTKDMLLETQVSAMPVIETKKKTVNGKVEMDAQVSTITGRYDYKLVENHANNNTSLIISRTRIKEPTMDGQMISHYDKKSGGKTVVRVNCSAK